MMRRATPIILLVGLVTGCGGTQTSSSSAPASKAAPATTATTTAAPTHEQFIRQLDALCRRANNALAKYQKQLAAAVANNDYASASAVLSSYQHDYARPYTARIAALTPPDVDRGAFQRYVRALQRQIGLTDRTIAALKAKDSEAVAAIGQIQDSVRDGRVKAALDLGSKDCGAV